MALWPSYLAFALSFFVILVTWITHHDLMRLVRATDHPVRLANGCTLLYVTFIPFPTAVLAEHLGGPQMSTAVAFYCGTFVFGSAAFNLLVATIDARPALSPGGRRGCQAIPPGLPDHLRDLCRRDVDSAGRTMAFTRDQCRPAGALAPHSLPPGARGGRTSTPARALAWVGAGTVEPGRAATVNGWGPDAKTGQA